MGRVIWMLNHYALTPDLPGGTRHFDLARELTRLGYDVTIFASAFNHHLHQQVRLSQGEPWSIEVVDGVTFVWLPSFPYRTNNWRRVVNMLDYAWRAYRLGRSLPRREPQIAAPHVVIGCAVHLFAVLAGYFLSRRHDAHFLMEVRDLWPQTFLDMGVWQEGELRVTFFRWLERFLYGRAERIVTLSPLTRDYLAGYSKDWAEKVVYIPNGTTTDRFGRTTDVQRSRNGPLTVMYLGAIGPTNGLDLVIDAMNVVEQSKPRSLECRIVGDGPDRARLQKTVQGFGLESVKFEDPVPRKNVPQTLARADILVLVQREVLYGSSNKLYDYMASGKPIVFAVFAEHNNLVEEVGCGVSALPDDAEDLASKLLLVAQMSDVERRSMGDRGRDFVRQHCDYAILAKKLAEAMETLD